MWRKRWQTVVHGSFSHFLGKICSAQECLSVIGFVTFITVDITVDPDNERRENESREFSVCHAIIPDWEDCEDVNGLGHPVDKPAAMHLHRPFILFRRANTITEIPPTF